ncbi:TPA: 2-phosphosulfolactate phosphatase [Candidatus Bathyarchaeota archaeon]|nr:2-phosphosulfolactate phosphatase [Candidatus Bathyarchaeota archaeon]
MVGMKVKVNLEVTAKDTAEAARRGNIMVVIDVLRCTSSMINALANGARRIIPVKTLREAYKLKSEHPSYLLAGERGGTKPKGFDFGNSPLEFTRDKVQRKTLISTTTSGTVALSRCRTAKSILITSFLNVSSAASKAMKIASREEKEISIVPSGRRGQFSLEDFLCGGAIVEKLIENDVILSDSAFASLLSFQQAKDSLLDQIRRGEHAQSLVKLGFEDDVKFCCQVDIFDIAPSLKNNAITL